MLQIDFNALSIGIRIEISAFEKQKLKTPYLIARIDQINKSIACQMRTCYLYSQKNCNGSSKQMFQCTKNGVFRDFVCKCHIWSHLLKKSLMENFIFCAVFVRQTWRRSLILVISGSEIF